MLALFETIILCLALAGCFFLPGWLLVRLGFQRQFTRLEESLYAFALGLTLINGLLLILDRFNIPLSFTTLTSSLGLILITLGCLLWYRRHQGKNIAIDEKAAVLPDLTTRTWSVLLIMLLATIGIRTYYLIPAGLPTATDMGHHMYWSQFIVEKHALPEYQKIEVVRDPDTGHTTLTPPVPIADFIIGEHIPFAAIALLTSLSFIGSFPVIVLLMTNILSTLALLALAWRVGDRLLGRAFAEVTVLGTFLFIGPLFALASPQAKFVSGGVVGNTFGNFFIPLILLALYLALRDKRPRFLVLAIVLITTLAYTHHLSTLVLGFSVLGTALLAAIAIRGRFAEEFSNWIRVVWQPSIGITIGLVFMFGLMIAVPSYLQGTIIGSAIGSPIKTTRTGLTFFQINDSLGVGKTAFGLFGLALLLFGQSRLRRSDALGWALFTGWTSMLAIMALRPDWLFLDIPSNRIGSYLIYPGALMAGLGLSYLLFQLAKDRAKRSGTLLALALLTSVFANGIFENGAVLPSRSKSDEVQEVFAASHYLSQVTDGRDIILKDHNYLAADAWMKLFFLRDYGYPLSRGLFSRYEETGSRKEHCTLVMIASPNGTEARECFNSTGTNYIVVNPTYDAVQFEKSNSFSKIYSSSHVVVFKRLR